MLFEYDGGRETAPPPVDATELEGDEAEEAEDDDAAAEDREADGKEEDAVEDPVAVAEEGTTLSGLLRGDGAAVVADEAPLEAVGAIPLAFPTSSTSSTTDMQTSFETGVTSAGFLFFLSGGAPFASSSICLAAATDAKAATGIGIPGVN